MMYIVYPKENKMKTAILAAVAVGSCTARKYTLTSGVTPSIEHMTPRRQNIDNTKATIDIPLYNKGL